MRLNSVRLIVWILAAAACAVAVRGQETGFEVAAIKPSRARGVESNVDSTPGGRLACTNITVRELIRLAYGVKDYQIERAPSWVDGDRFDIAARNAGGKSTTYEELQSAVRGLLAGRFALAAHRETRQGQVYLLVLGRSGSKMTGHNEGAGSGSRTSCGHLAGKRLTADVIATVLSRQLEREVVNRTGLAGKFDFELNWTPDSGPCPGSPEGLPSLFSALQEQLGLKLDSGKGAIETLVIDRVARPSEN